MPASRELQSHLDVLHREFMHTDIMEPLEFLKLKMIPINKRMRKYVKCWRDSKRKLVALRKKESNTLQP